MPTVMCGCGFPQKHPIHDDPRAGLDIDEEPKPEDQWPGAHPWLWPSEAKLEAIVTQHKPSESIFLGDRAPEHFVFTFQGFISFLNSIDATVHEAIDDAHNWAMPNACVVDTDQAWAGPALHMIAQALSISKHVSFDSDQATAIQRQADYFERHAMKADDGRMDLPGQDEPS